MDVPLCPSCVFSFQLCPIRGKTKIHGDNFPVPSSLYKVPNEGLNVSLGHKGAPLPTVCLPYITVPRNGQKRAQFREYKILKKSVLYLNEDGACFTLRITLLLRKKRHLLGVEILGEQAPLAP